MIERELPVNLNEFLGKAVSILVGKVLASDLSDDIKKSLVEKLESKDFFDSTLEANSDHFLYRKDLDPEHFAQEMFKSLLENDIAGSSPAANIFGVKKEKATTQ